MFIIKRAVNRTPDVLDCASHFGKMLYDNAQLARVYLHAWQLTGDEFYRTIAEETLDYVAREMRSPEGGFYSTQDADSEGEEGKFFVWTVDEIRDVLADQADEFTEAYGFKRGGNWEGKNVLEFVGNMSQPTFDPHWFVAAQGLAETMPEHLADSEGTLYDTSDDHESLITRPRDLQDNATPSGNAMAVTALLRLVGFTNNLRYVDIPQQALVHMQPIMGQYPLGFGQWLQALAYALSKPREVAIVRDPDSADTQTLLSIVHHGYRPYQVVALGEPGAHPAVPLLKDRSLVDGQATAYVCRDFTCQVPVTGPLVLEQLLNAD